MGRPRSFNREHALQAAMKVFWARGFEETSLDDLVGAMGINRPSLYGAFGSKEQLFLECLSFYDRSEGELLEKCLAGAITAREAVEAYLRYNAAAYVRPELPRGCMSMTALRFAGSGSDVVTNALRESRQASLSWILARLAQGLASGDLAPSTDIQQLARFYASVGQGMSAQAVDGASQRELEQVVEAAMRAWPTDTSEVAP